MKPAACAFLVGAVLVASQPRPEAQTAKFRHLASIYADQKGVGFSLPEGVACGAAGDFVVADTGNDRLVRFTFRDKTVSGGSSIQIPELSSPTRVHLDSTGRLYALDSKSRRIVQLNGAGAFVAVVSFDGVPPPNTSIPKSFAIDSTDSLYVLDVFSARVLVIDALGKVARIMALPATIGFGSELAVDETGTVLLLDSVGRRLYSAPKDAATFAPLGGDLSEVIVTLPTFLTVSRGTTFVGEGPGGRIISLRRDGSFLARQLSAGREDGSLDQPAQMCVNANDEVFIADRDNSRVQIFQLIR